MKFVSLKILDSQAIRPNTVGQSLCSPSFSHFLGELIDKVKFVSLKILDSQAIRPNTVGQSLCSPSFSHFLGELIDHLFTVHRFYASNQSHRQFLAQESAIVGKR